MLANILEYEIPGAFSVKFFADELNSRPDFYISTNAHSLNIDILIFFDSRGVSNSFEDSIVDRVIKDVEKTQTYLLVSRPLEITTWMTLYNFVRLNGVNPRKIITNMGFVDFTPKKMSIVEKSIIQYNYYFSEDQAKIEFLEQYDSKDEISLDLYMQDYPEIFKKDLEERFKNVSFLIINTPILVSNYEFVRPRPRSFFSNLIKGNRFNKELNLKAEIFEFDNFSSDESYDGVHYTKKGNDLIFAALKRFL